jgi:hypothetical protein
LTNLVTSCEQCNHVKGDVILPDTPDILAVVEHRTNALTPGDETAAREISLAFTRTPERLDAIDDWVELGLLPLR